MDDDIISDFIEPAIPDPDFFDAQDNVDNNLHLPAVTNDVLLSQQQVQPANVVACVAGAELKYDDDMCEFNEFLIGVEAITTNPKEEKKLESGRENVSETGESTCQEETETTSVDEKDSKDRKSEGEEKSSGAETISTNDSVCAISNSGPNTPDSRTSSVARVSLSLPVAPKLSFTSSSTKKKSQTSSSSPSPPRITRGRITQLNKNDANTKRKLSASDEEYEPDEDSSTDIGKDSEDEKVNNTTTKSGRKTRRTTRYDNDDSNNQERPETTTTRSRRILKKVARYNNEEEVGDDYKSNRKINVKERDSSPDSDSIFEPVKKRKKQSNYWFDDDDLTYYQDGNGKVSILKPCSVNIVRLTEAEIVKLTGGESLIDDPDNPFLLEVCIDNFLSAKEAVLGGAKRIELCSSLAEGGLTPSGGFLTLVKETFRDIPVFVMIRPRGGDFVYSAEEIEIMARDISHYKQMGADGFVFGVLTKDCKVDVDNCKLLKQAAHPLECTFHRAFDKVANPDSALETIISMGFTRILTSGQAATAQSGVPVLRRLVDAAGSRIKIMAGAGLTQVNVGEIVRRTGVKEVHGSASKSVASNMCAAGPSKSHKRGGRPSSVSVNMGSTDDSVIKVTDSKIVAQIVRNGRKHVRR